eukprot:Gb_31997 [translate_table: standard]
MMMQESPSISTVSSPTDQFIGQYKDQQRSSMTPKVQDDQALRCPRCDSPNTKFCYYNNYNLTQPRHFCKTCRRYWTKGGALRNVPIGGGCRKNKRSKQRSKDQNPLITLDQHEASPTSLNVSNGLSLLQNLWAPSSSSLLDMPNTDRFSLAFAKFQGHSSLLAGNNMNGNNNKNNNNSSTSMPIMSVMPMRAESIGDPSGGHMATLFENHAQIQGLPSSTTASSPAGMLVDGTSATSFNFGQLESFNNNNGINSDLHWRIQQQRLAMLLADQGQNIQDSNNNNNIITDQILPGNDQSLRYHHHHHQIKGKSVVSSGISPQVYDNRPTSEWQNVAECVFEPTTGESSYWQDLPTI